jgi:chemotaxis response regulator CheB
MSDDGESELKQIRDEGDFTIAQGSSGFATHRMPGEALALIGRRNGKADSRS